MKKKIVIGITGSIAAFKAIQLISDLNKEIDKYLDELKPEVDKELRNLGLLKIDENGNEYPVLGCCHTQWDLQKKLLKERYGIDWKNPAERSPFIDFD